MFCECGVTLDYGEDRCEVCAGAPHDRDCMCPECVTYWHDVAERTAKAADDFATSLVCSCGWVGMWVEQHDKRRPDCKLTRREPDHA